jgi:hypothetical protein
MSDALILAKIVNPETEQNSQKVQTFAKLFLFSFWLMIQLVTHD